MRAEGIDILGPGDLRGADLKLMETHFFEQVFPILSPLAIDPAHPVPVHRQRRLRDGAAAPARGRRHRARGAAAGAGAGAALRAAARRRRRGRSASCRSRRCSRSSSASSSPATRMLGHCAFRVLRDSDLEVEEEAEDLVREFETALKRRRRGEVIQLTMTTEAPDDLRHTIVEALGVAAGRGDRDPRADRHRRPRRADPGRAAGPALAAVHAADAGAGAGLRGRHLRGDPPEGHAAAPPLRDLRHRGALPAAGGARPGRAGDQADALPHLARQPDRRGALRGGGGGQVGDRADRAQGALRRGGEHPAEPAAGAGRGAGGLRLHRLEDPRQDLDGGAPRGGRARHLHPFRHRQLSPGDRRHLHRPLALHLRQGAGARRDAGLQLRHRLRPAGGAREARDLAAHAEAAHPRRARGRDRACPRRAAGAGLGQAQRHHRPRDDRRALCREPGRGEDRHGGARHLRPARRGRRASRRTSG